jgi:hypothetical protein
MARQFNIVNGPSKWDLMLSLFDGGSSFPRRRDVEFRFEHPGPASTANIFIFVVINAVERVNGGDENWYIKGYIMDLRTMSQSRSIAGPVAGRYSTLTRKGWLKAKVNILAEDRKGG